MNIVHASTTLRTSALLLSLTIFTSSMLAGVDAKITGAAAANELLKPSSPLIPEGTKIENFHVHLESNPKPNPTPTPAVQPTATNRSFGSSVGNFICGHPTFFLTLTAATASLAWNYRNYKKTCQMSDVLNQTREDLRLAREENRDLHNRAHNDTRVTRHILGAQMKRMQRENQALHQTTHTRISEATKDLQDTLEEANGQNLIAHTATRDEIAKSHAGIKKENRMFFVFGQTLLRKKFSEVQQSVQAQNAAIVQQGAQLNRIEEGISNLQAGQKAQNQYVAQNGVCVLPVTTQKPGYPSPFYIAALNNQPKTKD